MKNLELILWIAIVIIYNSLFLLYLFRLHNIQNDLIDIKKHVKEIHKYNMPPKLGEEIIEGIKNGTIIVPDSFLEYNNINKKDIQKAFIDASNEGRLK